MTDGPIRTVGRAWWPAAIASAISVGIPGALAASRAGVPAIVGFALGALAGGSAVMLLPSLPSRVATVTMVFFGGLALVRYSGRPGVDTRPLVLWAVVTLAALFAGERARGAAVPALRRGGVPTPAGAGRTFAAFLVAVLACGALLAAIQAAAVERGAAFGSTPTPGGWRETAPSLLSFDRVDLRGRPELSDEVVFTVEAAAPDFWRGATFDVWDGIGWTRSDDALKRLPWEPGPVTIEPPVYDVAAVAGESMRQTVTIEAPFVEGLFAAPTPVEVTTRHLVGVRSDGTVTFLEPLGRGATYTVVSRRAFATEETLRAADAAVPAAILERYAAPAVTTERVRRLAATVTAAAPTTYDKVRAIEAWLGRNTRYSLDAPASPEGADAVDHFLFETQVGWCEQVASSLAVMLRSVGVPARLATGFVTGERNPVSGRYVVRERDAHAWVEVYFPGVGWQGFDPTASVPLAGEAERPPSAARSMVVLAGVLAAVLLLAAVGGPAARGVTRWSRRHRARRAAPWATKALRRLESLGARAGRARRPGETPVRYAKALAGELRAPELARVGRVIDRDAFSARGVSPGERAAAEAILTARSRRRARATVGRP